MYKRQLCAIPSPSGFTAEVSDYLRETFRGIGLEPIRTRKGSVLVDLGGRGDPLVLATHVDTLGGMVRSTKPNGRIRITKIGGFSEHTVEGVENTFRLLAAYIQEPMPETGWKDSHDKET